MFVEMSEELIAGSSELVKGFVIALVEHCFLEELPKTLNQVEIRGVRWQEYELYLGGLQILGNGLSTVIAGIVTDDVNPSGFGILSFNLLKQFEGGLRVDGVVITHDGTQVVGINNAIDGEPLPSGIGAQFVDFAAFDPAITGYRVVLGMRGVHEVDSVIWAFGVLELFILGHERLLPCRIGFAGDQFGLFVDKSQPVQ